MEQPLNILWKKSPSPSSDIFIDIYAVPGHEISTDGMETLIDLLFQTAEIDPINQRDNSKAETARELGKKLFANEKYLEAMTKFNAGLSFAKKGSTEEGMAYANWSSCFFRLKMIKECLTDIEMAKKSNYPDRLKQKLEQRVDTCTRSMNDEHFMDGVFIARKPKLSFNEHSDFAGVADCLKIQENAEFGRHIITTHDLKIGQTIFIEEPFSATPKRFYISRNSRCLGCFAPDKNFITCLNCVGARFCDVECMKKSFHKYECNMPGNLSRKETFELVLRMFFNTVTAFPNVSTLMSTVDLLLNGQDPADLTSAQKAFCWIFKLPHNHDKQSDFHLKRLRGATQVAIITIMRFLDLKRKFSTTKQLRFLQHLILHLFHVAEHAINLTEYIQEGDEAAKSYTIGEHATGMYPFGCNFKHSCVSNVSWFFIDGRLVCKVIRPIKKGEQLFRSYYPSEFSLKRRLELKVELEARYHFECNCLVCTDENWSPMTDEINLSDDPLYCIGMQPAALSHAEIRKLSPARIDEYEKNAIAFLTKCDRFHPVNDTICMQSNLEMIWNVLSTTRF